MFKVTLLPDAETSFKKLDKSLPDDLRGLCRIRAGDYRIIYWIYYEMKQIRIYEIEHRSRDYRSLKK